MSTLDTITVSIYHQNGDNENREFLNKYHMRKFANFHNLKARFFKIVPGENPELIHDTTDKNVTTW